MYMSSTSPLALRQRPGPVRALAAVAAAATGGGLLLAVGPAPAQADAPPACTLTQSEISIDSRVEPGLTADFSEYGNLGGEWTGGDSTFSVPLEDGRIVWVFSDTFLGEVADDLSRPESSPFINNSFVVQDSGSLTTVHGGSAAEPEALLPPPGENAWYWVGDGMQDRDGNIQLTALRYWYGGGMWDFGWDSTHLATFDSDTFELLSFTDLPSSTNVQWASWIEPAGEVTYVYGVEDNGGTKYMHVARVNAPDLNGDWEFWTGDGWSPDEADSVRVMPGVANEYSVAAFEGGYLLITQDTNELFSRNVLAYVSCSPTGPFELVGTVYAMPEVGAFGSYGNANIFGYNAHEHPELRGDGSTVITYNVNSFVSSELYQDATIYRPRFVEVDLTVVPECRAAGRPNANGQSQGGNGADGRTHPNTDGCPGR